MFKSSVLRPACCLLVCAIALGQVKKVNLKTGGFLKGEVTETEDGYEVKTRVGVVTVSKDKVVSIEDVVTPEQEYQERLKKIDPKKPEDRYEVGRWAFEKGLLKIAQKELTTALELKKDYELAELLLRRVEAKLKAAERAETRPATGKPGITVRGIDPNWLVTEEEIYRIRLEELRRTDRVLVRFRAKLLNRFIDMMQGRGDFERPRFADQFRAMTPVQQVLYILDKVDRDNEDIKDDILIKSDPQFMIDFRRRIWPIVASYCATASCHGGERPLGRLRLFNIGGRSERVDYTNFLILDRAYGGRRMIDRDHKDMSLLLQFGLPPEQAQNRHPRRQRDPRQPEIKIKVPYTTRSSRNYRRVLGWIESLKGPPPPDYRVELRIPWAPKDRGIILPEISPVTTQPAGESVPRKPPS